MRYPIAIVIALLLISPSLAWAGQPHPWYCGNYYLETNYFYETSRNYTFQKIDAASGVATDANPDWTGTIAKEKTQEATASNTLGIDDTVVATTTIGVSVGWTQTVSQTFNLNWPAGTAWTAEIGFKYVVLNGTVTQSHISDNTSCWASCNGKGHLHHGTFTASKYIETYNTHTPTSN